ncbi:cutinase-domain-containing protein [Aspergillus novoparasiticus]|uniref:cutinase n=1 Tax=Aspergillus novoparasiticus TaxID=986946 RepID=A0A5N6E783_9EURO|nr:cutinase-domain-containing protein [Aspergillus novoparasiticus]
MALLIRIFLSLLVCHSVWARSPLIRSGVAVEYQNRNDLFGETTCKKVTLIFARGTFEPGNMGVLVGPDLENALAHELGESSLAVQGVAYPANLDGYLDGGDAEGASLLAALVRRSLGQCPNSAVVLSGYR